MTEKRFKHMRNRLGMQFIGYDDKYVLLGTFADAEGVKYIVDLLNDLSEENEYLEKRFKEEEWHYEHIDEDRDVWMYKCQELEKENEELKKDCSNLIDDNTEYVAEINQMHKENEELKKEVKQLKNKIKTYNSTHELLKETIDRLRNNG